jgi:hypothetical protein
MMDAAGGHIVMEENRRIRQQSVRLRSESMHIRQTSYQFRMYARQTIETSRELCQRTTCLILHRKRRLT